MLTPSTGWASILAAFICLWVNRSPSWDWIVGLKERVLRLSVEKRMIKYLKSVGERLKAEKPST